MRKRILIEGMKFNKCATHVQEGLEEIDEIISVNLDLQNKTATIDGTSSLRNEFIIDRLDVLGYTVVSIEEV